MQIRNSIIMLVLVVGFGCKDNNPENTALKKTTPKIEDISKELNYIFTNGFLFTENVIIKKIGVKRIGIDRYEIVYFLNSSVDFKKVEELNIAFRVYPENPEEFKADADQKNKAKTFATKCELNLMGDSFVIKTDELSIVPKKFKETKLYFYKSSTGIVGKTMTILDLNFDF